MFINFNQCFYFRFVIYFFKILDLFVVFISQSDFAVVNISAALEATSCFI